jgi:hypothetical protein
VSFQESNSRLAGTSAANRVVVPEQNIWKPKKKVALTHGATFFTAWHVYSGNGIFNVRFDNPNMNTQSNVMVSISEMTADDIPFIGDAPMSVANVAPFDNGAWVKVNIGWDQSLRFQLMFVWGQ